MAYTSHLRAIEVFRAQFSPDGDGYIYRRLQKGAAIRVSAHEYQSFVDAFRRTQRHLKWGLVGGIIAIVLATTFSAVAFNLDPESTIWTASIFVPMLALVFVFVWLSVRSYGRPAHLLERRAPISGALSREEFRQQYMAKLSWQALIGRIATLFAICVAITLQYDILHGWGRLWLGLIALFAAAAVLQLWRKWRFDASLA